METPLTPLEFARRSRKLYPEREAVVDGDLRLSYEQFFDRCDTWSVEVEGALLRHPAVQEVAIVGMPDERWGEAPHAFVVLEAGATATETELRNYARDHLAHFKCPRKFSSYPSCRKQPPARSRSMSFAASPRFRSSDRPNDVTL